MVLTPPPVARIRTPPGTFALSFHTISGIGPSADDKSALLPAAQKIPAPSLNSVPPTATLFGVEARPLTARIVPTAALLASTCCARVTRAHKSGDALCRSLGPQVVPECV